MTSIAILCLSVGLFAQLCLSHCLCRKLQRLESRLGEGYDVVVFGLSNDRSQVLIELAIEDLVRLYVEHIFPEEIIVDSRGVGHLKWRRT